MISFHFAWFASALALVALTGWWGSRAAGTPFAILIDERGRYSLNQLQLVIWTVLIGSTLLGTLASRYSMGFADHQSASVEVERLNGEINELDLRRTEIDDQISQADPQSKNFAALKKSQQEILAQIDAAKSLLGRLSVNPFNIPGTLLGLMGIVATSVASAGAVKSNKNVQRREMIRGQKSRGFAASVKADDTPRPLQVITEEEGGQEQDLISVPKFQNLIFTLAIVIAYVVVTYQTSDYPKFDQSIVTLIGISHAGYVAGKIPDKN